MTVSLIEVSERSLFTVAWTGEAMAGESSVPPPAELPTGTDLGWVAAPADLVVEALRPLLRALLLSGRRPRTISVGGVLGSPLSSHPWVVIDVEARAFVEVGSVVIDGVPANATVAAEITVTPEYHSADVARLVYREDELGPATSDREPVEPADADHAALTLAVELPDSPPGTLLFDLPTTEDGRLVVWSTGSTVADGPYAALGEVAAIGCDAIAARLEPVWAQMTPDSLAGTGLLWLFDPANWWADDWEYQDPEHARAKRALERVGGRALHGTADRASIAEFLREQMDGSGPVGEQLTGWFPNARAKNLRTQVARLLATGSVVTPQRVDSWEAACWFDLILEWARLDVLRPPALPSPGVIVTSGDDEEESCEFVTSRTNEEITILWLSVTGPDELRAELMGVAANAPLEEVIAWELVQRPEEKDLLVVVAAPGVQITLPDVNPWWEWKIIRVQDRALIPPYGQPIVIDVLLAPFPIALEVAVEAPLPAYQATPPDMPIEGVPPIGGEPMAMVFPGENGCRIEYPVYENGQRLGPPSFVAELEVDPLSGVDRYAFDVLLGLFPESPDFSGSLPLRRAARFTFWLTSTPMLKLTYSVLDLSTQFEYWLVPADVELPRFGESLPTGIPLAFFLPPGALTPGGRTTEDFEALTPDEWSEDEWDRRGRLIEVPSDVRPEADVSGEWALMLADLLVGFVPIVGDAVDVVEFGNALYNGTDRWGRPVTYFDLAIMGACAAVPFASSGLVRGAARGITDLAKAPFSAGATPWTTFGRAIFGPPTQLVDEATQAALQKGARLRNLPPAEQLDVVGTLRRALDDGTGVIATKLVNETLDLKDLLTNKGEFWIPPLQWSYARWKNARLKVDKAADVSPVAYWEAARGRSRAMLDAMLGPSPREALLLRRRAQLSNGRNWVRIPTTVRAGGDAAAAMTRRTGEVLDRVEDLIRARPEGGNALVYRQRVRRLLESVCPNGNLSAMTTDGMVRIMGRQTLHPDELAARLVGALDIATDEVTAARDIAGAAITIDHFLGIPNIDGYFQDLITLSGPGEHGAAAEAFALATMLAEGQLFKYQQYIGGKKGPDAIRYVGQRKKPQIVQVKAFKNLKNLTAASANAEIYRQLQSDLARLIDEFGDLKMPSYDDPTRMVFIHDEIVFKIDRDYLMLNSRRADFEFFEELEIELMVVQDQLNAFLRAAQLGRNVRVKVEAVSRSGL